MFESLEVKNSHTSSFKNLLKTNNMNVSNLKRNYELFPSSPKFQGNLKNIDNDFLRRLANLLVRSICDTTKMIKVIRAI